LLDIIRDYKALSARCIIPKMLNTAEERGIATMEFSKLFFFN
jgi:hypothetical protein